MTQRQQENIYARDLRGMAKKLEALTDRSPYIFREDCVKMREIANYLEDLLQ